MNINRPFFSVIMPLYNKAPYVANSLRSVLKQSFQNFELIIVNDASTDGSVEEVQKFNDPRIRLFHRNKPGPGGYAARNLGINEAQSEWVTFLDADDEWKKHHLKSAYQLIAVYPDSSFFSFAYQSERSGNKFIKSCTDRELCLNKIESLNLYAKRNFLHTNSVIIKRTEVKSAGSFPAGKFLRGGDSDLWLRLIIRNNGIVLSPIVTSCYKTDHSGVISNKKSLKSKHPIIQTITKEIELTDNYEEKKVLKKIANRKSFECSKGNKNNGNFKVKEFRNFYIREFSIKDWLNFFSLTLPHRLFFLKKRIRDLLRKNMME